MDWPASSPDLISTPLSTCGISLVVLSDLRQTLVEEWDAIHPMAVYD